MSDIPESDILEISDGEKKICAVRTDETGEMVRTIAALRGKDR